MTEEILVLCFLAILVGIGLGLVLVFNLIACAVEYRKEKKGVDKHDGECGIHPGVSGGFKDRRSA